MQTWKTLWHTLKTVLWFTWRHVLISSYSCMIFVVFVQHGINIKNVSITCVGLIFLDWIKMKFKVQFNHFDHRSSDAPQPLHVQNYWNDSVVGSPSYLSSMGSSSHYR